MAKKGIQMPKKQQLDERAKLKAKVKSRISGLVEELTNEVERGYYKIAQDETIKKFKEILEEQIAEAKQNRAEEVKRVKEGRPMGEDDRDPDYWNSAIVFLEFILMEELPDLVEFEDEFDD